MSVYFKLVKALIAAVEPSGQEKKFNKVFYGIMGAIAVFGIMIPMAFFVGVIIYSLTGELLKVGAGKNAIELFLQLVSVFSFVFGLLS